ncbi:MAG: ArnT family glycosyltransferase [Phycisphaerae bacterium]
MPDATPAPRGPAPRPRARRVSLRTAAVALVVVNVFARTVRYGLGFPIWGDEAFVAVNFLRRGFVELIAPLLYGQIAPLGYMWATLVATRLGGVNEWSLRLVSYLAGVASMLLFARFCWRQLKPRVAVLAIAFFAGAVLPIRHAAELKPYASDVLLALAVTTGAVWVSAAPRAAGRWVALTLLASAAVWCSYPVAFVVAGVATVLLVRVARLRAAPALAGWVVFSSAVAASFAAMVVLYAQPHAEAAAGLVDIEMWKRAFPPTDEWWKFPAWLVLIHTGNMFAYPAGGPNGASTATFVLFLIGCGYVWRARRDLFWLLLSPLPFAFVAALLKRYPYGGQTRTSLFLAPLICFMAGAGLFAVLVWLRRIPALRTEFSRRVTIAVIPRVALAFALLPLIMALRDFARPYKDEFVRRSREVADGIAAAAGAADPIIVFNALEKSAHGPWLGDWRGTGAQFVFDMLRLPRAPVSWAPAPNDVAVPPHGRLHLVAYRGVKVEFPQAQFDAYRAALAERFGPAEHTWFQLKLDDGRAEGVDWYVFPRIPATSPSDR